LIWAQIKAEKNNTHKTADDDESWLTDAVREKCVAHAEKIQNSKKMMKKY